VKRLFLLGICAIAFCLLIQGNFKIAYAHSTFRARPHSPNLISQTLPQKDRSIETEAQQLYEQGQLPEAGSLLKQAIKEYKKLGKINDQAISYRNLALIYQQQGEWQQAKQALWQAKKLILNLPQAEQPKLLAKTLEAEGQIQLSLAQPELALDAWKQATSIYQQTGNLTGFTQGKIYQAQALQALGFYAQAIETLTTIRDQLINEPNTIIKVKALNSIGDVLRRVGQYQESKSALTKSLIIAKQLNSKPLQADVLIALGNTAKIQEKPIKALEYYQQAIAISPHLDTRLQGKLNQLSLLLNEEQSARVVSLISEIEEIITEIPLSQTTIQGRIDLARLLLKLDQIEPQRITKHLVTAIKQARKLTMPRVEVTALGTLGKLYEQHQRLSEARQLTEKALLISQGINASDEVYQWQWQLGRILNAQGEKKEAITAYTQAVNNLRSLRSDLAAISSQIQFSFRESVEPVYRELVELLLSPEATQADLTQAREVIESLQLAELDNFFRDACLDAQPVEIDNLDPKAAIIYTIILKDRLQAIAAIPGQPLQHYTTNIHRSEIEISITSANSLISRSYRRLNLEVFQQAYNWLIRPIEKSLAANNIETLVFVPDGVLRNLPPATFHDGKQYLIEKYNIAIAPSLQLIEPQPLQTVDRGLLVAGLSEARQGFPPLPGTKQEIDRIQQQFDSETLFNESFTESNFARLANSNPYRIIHLATHGKFSSKSEDTFILTWSGRLNINELNNFIRGDKKQTRPIELLVLSACQTAAGDEQAALGLAGIAVRAGAKSTIASLWTVSDDATALLMTRFYEELGQENTTKAQALRRAQQALIKDEQFAHPFYWSAFILVGNWL
jgi:CHAT domain-containing protein